MKLDTKHIRYLTSEDWRVLTAVEMGSKNHEVVPTPLITQIAGLRGGTGVHKSISALAKTGLIAKVKNAKYDGYRLTYGGLDYLALNSHRKANHIYSVGNRIGVGKESDIYVVASPSGVQRVLKIHRLGRISFRTVKSNRDYLRNRNSASWMYMSRLAAMKEFAFMTALRDNGFPVPEPIAQNRHQILMSLIDAFPLRQIAHVPDPASLYADLLNLILRLASVGLIHGDFNEFNILIEERASTPALSSATDPSTDAPPAPRQEQDPPPTLTLHPIVIDFPQMVSISHPNAQYYFDRDVACIKRFFRRRFGFTSDEPGPFFEDAVKPSRLAKRRLDVEVEASGFSKKMAKELDAYMKEVGAEGAAEKSDGEEAEDEDEEDRESDDEAEADKAETEGEDEHSAHPNAMTVLEIQDFEAPTAPAASDKVAASAPVPVAQPPKPAKSAKKAAGWAI